MMKHNVTCGNWSRAGTYPGSSAEVSKASSKDTSSSSQLTNKEQVQEHLKTHGFKARYTYKYLADQLGTSTDAIFRLRKQLQKENKI